MPHSLDEPHVWPYRIIIFGPGSRIQMKMFQSVQVRDAEARDLKLEKEQTAIGVSVNFLIDGGDEPKR